MKKDIAIVFFLYTIFAILWTEPLILYMGSFLPRGSFSHFDPYLNVWILAWDTHILFSDPLNFYNAPVFFPAKQSLVFSEHMLGNAIISLPVKIFTDNPVVQYNFCFLIVLIISGLGMYALYKHIAGTKIPAFLTGIFFTFSMLKFRYITLLQVQSVQWVPFTLLFFIKFTRNKDYKNLMLFLIFLFLSAITSIYVSLMFGVYLLFFFLFLLFLPGERHFDRTFFVRLVPSSIFTLSVILFIHVPYLKNYLSGFYVSYPERQAEVLSNSAGLSSYFNIPPNSWLWSKFLPSAISLNGLSPGIFLTLLALFGIFYIFKDKKGLTKSLFFSIFFAGFITFLLSFGPKIFLYRVLSAIIPIMEGIRVPDRFSLFFLFSLSLVAGRGIEGLMSKKSLVTIILLFFLLENSKLPLLCKYVPEILRPEPVYLWLRDQPDDTVVLELPMPSETEEMWLETKYTISSVHHWKRIANGYSGYFPNSYHEIRKTIFGGFPKRETLVLLKNYGIKLIIVHTEYFDKEIWKHLSKFIQESPLVPVRDFGNDKVYKIPDDLR